MLIFQVDYLLFSYLFSVSICVLIEKSNIQHLEQKRKTSFCIQQQQVQLLPVARENYSGDIENTDLFYYLLLLPSLFQEAQMGPEPCLDSAL